MTRTTVRCFSVVLIALVPLVAGGCAWITRVSVDSAGNEGGAWSGHGALNEDGRYVAFASQASNLVAGDTNGASDVFVHDRQTGTTTRISVDSAGTESNDNSANPAISDDGRYVAFDSDASNLVAGDTNGTSDVFVHDREKGATSRVSNFALDPLHDQEAASNAPSISGDGRYVAYRSTGFLTLGGGHGSYWVFVHDRAANTTVAIPDSGSDVQDCSQPGLSISGNGRYVVYQQCRFMFLEEIDDRRYRDVLLMYDRETEQTRRVSVDPAGSETEAGGGRVSTEGRYVAFVSSAPNIVADDTNGQPDVFLHDQVAGTTARVTFDTMGQEAWIFSGLAMSDDGRYTSFGFLGWDEPLDTSVSAVFLHDRQTGTASRLISYRFGVSPIPEFSSVPLVGVSSISGDGRYLALGANEAAKLVADDTNVAADVYVRYTVAPTVADVSPAKAAPGSATNVTITGTGFHEDATVALGAGITVTSVNVLDETRIQAHISVAPDATTGAHNVQVTNVGSFGPLSGSTNFCYSCFTVT